MEKGDLVYERARLLVISPMARRQAEQDGAHVLPGAEGGAQQRQHPEPRALLWQYSQLHGAAHVPRLAPLQQPHHELFPKKLELRGALHNPRGEHHNNNKLTPQPPPHAYPVSQRTPTHPSSLNHPRSPTPPLSSDHIQGEIRFRRYLANIGILKKRRS